MNLFDIYSRLPVPLQHLAVSVKGLWLRHLRYNSEFWRYLDFLQASEWWDENELSDYQDVRLQTVVRHSFENVPYYRERMKARGLRPNDIRGRDDLDKLPVIDKQVVRDRLQDFVNTSANRWTLSWSRTSGTTGTPLRVAKTREAIARQRAVWWRHRARFGLTPGDKELSLGARTVVSAQQESPPFWRYCWPLNRTFLSPLHITDKNIALIVDWIDDQGFDFFTGYASALYLLAQCFQRADLKVHNRPRAVLTGADALLPPFKKTIRHAFGSPVSEHYGMVEGCGNISKCEEGTWHVDEEFGIFELLDTSDQVSGSKAKEIVFTGLTNTAMPLIRYKVGDLAVPGEDGCSCGRQSTTLKAITGRKEDFVETPDGRFVTGMNQVFKWADGVRMAQIVQHSIERLELRVLPESSFEETDVDVLVQGLRTRVGHEMEIDVREVSSVDGFQTSGKFRAVVNQMDENSGQPRVG